MIETTTTGTYSNQILLYLAIDVAVPSYVYIETVTKAATTYYLDLQISLDY
jgi:hypothetical protein